jgi:hypothetical protein
VFDSLEDTIKRDEQRSTSSRERIMRYAVIAVASVVIFGGLIFSIRLLD